MLVSINRKGEMKELFNKRNFSIQSRHTNLIENVDSKDPAVQAAIARDAAKFRQMTDLSARLAAL